MTPAPMTSPAAVRLLVAAVLLAGTAAWAVEAVPPGLPGAPAPLQQGNPSVSTQAPIRPAQIRRAPAPRPESSPTWTELTPQQQQSLAPLSATWRSLGAAHKRKWIALSENFATMPLGEQQLLHSRMAEWAALSPRQRTLARMNFAETKALPSTDKKAKWEAYQALSPEEKRKLAAGAAAKPLPPSTAAAMQPVPKQKLTRIAKPKKAENGGAHTAVAPGRVDQKTLLPKPGTVPVQP